MATPLISIALPVLNGTDFLAEAIESILAQDFTDFELVIADNASTDGTTEIALGYAARDTRVRVERSTALLPQVPNVNRAADLCRGDWIQFFCHDDVMAPGCLGRIAAAAAAAPAGVGLIGHGTGMLYNTKCYLPWGERSGASPLPYRGSTELPSVWLARPDATRSLNGRGNVRALLLRKGGVGVPSLTNACVRRTAWTGLGGFDKRFLHFDVFGWYILLLDWDYVFMSGTYTLTRLHGKQVAVLARKTLQSVRDHEIFWTEYLRGPASELVTGIQARLFKWSRVASIAAAPVAMELLQGRWLNAVKISFALPARLWPLLPAFVLRTYRTESRRISSLRGHLQMNEIYP